MIASIQTIPNAHLNDANARAPDGTPVDTARADHRIVNLSQVSIPIAIESGTPLHTEAAQDPMIAPQTINAPQRTKDIACIATPLAATGTLLFAAGFVLGATLVDGENIASGVSKNAIGAGIGMGLFTGAWGLTIASYALHRSRSQHSNAPESRTS